MNLTKQTNYAIRALMYCGAKGDRLSTISEIAAAYKVSELFLAKIMKPLISAGMVESIRGRSGGIRLAKQPEEISILTIVKVTEKDFAMAECFSAGLTDCPLVNNCTLNGVLGEALGAFFNVLDKYTIADLIATRPEISALLGIDEIGKFEARIAH